MAQQPEKISARDAGIKVVKILQDAGHVAYFAGGCVRDGLLGKSPHDYDVATDAHPEKVVQIFRSAKFVGEAFGVALVRLMGHEVQVATFRSESNYTDGRHPGKVVFTDAREDALRRDFTINGMFENPVAPDESGRIIDFVNGRQDLANKVIRAIGTPDDRFSEDYLRMLRAVRFASRMGFEIEPVTAAAIKAHARYLSQISRERIGQELGASLAGPGRAQAAALVQTLHLDGPSLNEEHKNVPLPTIALLAPDAGFPVALAAWTIDRLGIAALHPGEGPRARDRVDWLAGHLQAFVDRDLSDTGNRLRQALAMSNQHSEAFGGALLLLPTLLRWQSLNLAQQKRLLASTYASQALALAHALSHVPAAAKLMQEVDAQTPGLIAQDVRPEPFLTGQDLIKLGMKPGPTFKKVLQEAYDLQLLGQHTDRAQALAWLGSQK